MKKIAISAPCLKCNLTCNQSITIESNLKTTTKMISKSTTTTTAVNVGTPPPITIPTTIQNEIITTSSEDTTSSILVKITSNGNFCKVIKIIFRNYKICECTFFVMRS